MLNRFSSILRYSDILYIPPCPKSLVLKSRVRSREQGLFLRHLKITDFPTFTFSGCEQTNFRKNGYDMKQRDSYHGKTSCQAFVRVSKSFQRKFGDEAIRS
jgi:hypothetical protein